MRRRRIPRALTIAGSDSGAGAGIQADLKTFAAHGVYGSSVVTALTAQDTRGVRSVLPVRATFVRAQLDAVLGDIGADAVKTGMLYDASVIETVARVLVARRCDRIVVDPVMVAKNGAVLLRPRAVAALRRVLLPVAEVVTPNLAEAAALVGYPVETLAAMEQAGRDLVRLGARAALVKGGHLAGPAVDVLVRGSVVTVLRAARIGVASPHGTGCTLAAAIAAERACGTPLEAAVRAAKRYTAGCIRRAVMLGAGTPVLQHLPMDGAPTAARRRRTASSR